MALAALQAQHQNLSVVLIGNPGSGKSTLLNSIIGGKKFESGASYGEGKTKVLEQHTIGGIKFYDTPGLEDPELRQAAAEAITTALKKGGLFKVVFVCLTNSGRPREEDASTIELVTNALAGACPKDFAWGVILNQCEKRVFSDFETDKNQAFSKTCHFINKSLKSKTSFVHYEQRYDEAAGEDNAILMLSKRCTQFIAMLPVVEIDGPKVATVQADKWQQMKAMYQAQNKEMNSKLFNLTKELEKQRDANQRMEQQYNDAMRRYDSQSQTNTVLKELREAAEREAKINAEKAALQAKVEEVRQEAKRQKKCDHCGGRQKFAKMRGSAFACWDGRGTYDIINCTKCSNGGWITCAHDCDGLVYHAYR